MRRATTQEQPLPLLTLADCMIPEHQEARQIPDVPSMVLLDNGEMCQVTSWFDANGHDCDPSEAEFTVVGPCSDGSWHTIELGEYSNHRMQ